MSENILQTTLAREPHQNWKLADINLFLASQLVMGLTPEPSIENYFQQDSMGIFGSLWMQESFSRDKWTELNQHIHFDTNQCMQQLRVNIQQAWNLNQILVVDEMMRTFTGRWKHIQHVKRKPHNTGLKFYGLTDDSFYLWDFLLYQGEDSEREHTPTAIVMDFAKSAIKNIFKPHIIVTDSYYGSLNLALELDKYKLGCLLSCKSDRPAFLFSNHLHKDLDKGEFTSINNRHFSAMTYYDKAKVNLITNLFNTNKTINSQENNKTLPLGIYRYRKWLGGLDHFDRWLHLYLIQHKNIKWTQALFSTLLKIAVNNTNIIAMAMNFSTNLKETILKIIQHLKGSYSVRQDANRPSYQRKRSKLGHFPTLLKSSKDCTHCMNENKRSKTKYMCDMCKVHLHPACWVEYHNK